MKRLVYGLVIVLSLMLLGGCATATGGAEGSTGAESSTAKKEEMSAEELLKNLDYDPAEYAKLPEDYDSLKLTVEGDYTYTDQKFEDMINQYLASMQNYEPTDKKTVEEGDVANINYTGKIKGKEFDGGSAEDYDLVIGSGSFIEGFEEGLIGKKVGETVDLNLKFPKDYGSEDLNGKNVVFTVKINAIKKSVPMTYDTLTDEFVKENMGYYGYTTKDDFIKTEKENYKDNLENQKKQAIMSAYESALFEKTNFDAIPKKKIDEDYKKQKKDLDAYAKQNGMTTEEYLQSAGYTEEQFKETVAENYKKTVMYQSLIKAEDYKLDATAASEEIQNYIANYGMTEEHFYEQFGGKESVYLQIAYSEALQDMADSLEEKGCITFKNTEEAAAPAASMNKKQTLFGIIGLILLVAAVSLALLSSSSTKSATDDTIDEAEKEVSKNSLFEENNALDDQDQAPAEEPAADQAPAEEPEVEETPVLEAEVEEVEVQEVEVQEVEVQEVEVQEEAEEEK